MVFGRISAVTGQHDNSYNACSTEGLNGSRRLAPEFVSEQEGADRAPVDRHEDAQGGAPGGTP
jgi:hypothetical protein